MNPASRAEAAILAIRGRVDARGSSWRRLSGTDRIRSLPDSAEPVRGPVGLVNPREAWLTIMLIAAIGFINYVQSAPIGSPVRIKNIAQFGLFLS